MRILIHAGSYANIYALSTNFVYNHLYLAGAETQVAHNDSIMLYISWGRYDAVSESHIPQLWTWSAQQYREQKKMTTNNTSRSIDRRCAKMVYSSYIRAISCVMHLAPAVDHGRLPLTSSAWSRATSGWWNLMRFYDNVYCEKQSQWSSMSKRRQALSRLRSHDGLWLHRRQVPYRVLAEVLLAMWYAYSAWGELQVHIRVRIVKIEYVSASTEVTTIPYSILILTNSACKPYKFFVALPSPFFCSRNCWKKRR